MAAKEAVKDDRDTPRDMVLTRCTRCGREQYVPKNEQGYTCLHCGQCYGCG